MRMFKHIALQRSRQGSWREVFQGKSYQSIVRGVLLLGILNRSVEASEVLPKEHVHAMRSKQLLWNIPLVNDCSGDGDLCPEQWIGDGFPDCVAQLFGCDLTCYNNDGGDCLSFHPNISTNSSENYTVSYGNYPGFNPGTPPSGNPHPCASNINSWELLHSLIQAGVYKACVPEFPEEPNCDIKAVAPDPCGNCPEREIPCDSATQSNNRSAKQQNSTSSEKNESKEAEGLIRLGMDFLSNNMVVLVAVSMMCNVILGLLIIRQQLISQGSGAHNPADNPYVDLDIVADPQADPEAVNPSTTHVPRIVDEAGIELSEV